MPISRMQQPRQMYGLGSFVKKAVKKVANVAKDVVSSDVGKAALLLGGGYYLGGGQIPGLSKFLPAMKYGNAAGTGFGLGNILPNVLNIAKMPGLAEKAFSMGTVGKIGAGITAASIAGGMLTPKAQEDVQALRQSGDQGLLKAYLERYYRNLNPDADDETVASFVRANAANGGRMGYAFGTPEQNAMKAASVEGLPLNQNPAGITELDLRDNGGFIPPVGVKEKADDIPAMLSNNEFVFTADAVRNMGDGNVNKGAQRMYDFMKYLENGGRV